MKLLHGTRRFALFAAVLAIVSIGASLNGITPANAADCVGVQTSLVDCTAAKDQTGSPVVAILVIVIQVLTGLIGVVAIGALIYAGIMYASASGDNARINKSKELIRNTVIGLILFAGIVMLLNWLLPGGLFSGNAKFGAGGNGLGSIIAKKLVIDQEPNDDDDETTVTNGACYWDRTGDYPSGKLFHINNDKKATKHNSYAFENSPEGVRYAASKGYKRIDIDIQTTKDGVIVASHSTNPFMKKLDGTWGGFYDPAGNVKRGDIQDLTYAQVSRLRHKVGGYRIHKLEEIIAVAKQENIALALEIKTPKSIVKKVPAITAMINKERVKAYFIGITSKAGQSAALTEVRKHGFWGRYLWADKTQGPIKTTGCGK